MATRQVRRTSQARRKFQWARFRTINVLAAGAGGITRDDLLQTYLTEVGLTRPVGLTVVRIRGVLQLTSLAAASQGARVGMIIRNERPLAANVEDGPYNAQHDDWFAWYPLRSDPQGPSNTSSYVVDVRAMRKIEEVKQQLQMWMQSDPANAASCTVNADLSIGIKLP